MKKSVRKALFVSIKIAIAAGLLGWVLSQVHWRDYVQTVSGKEYAFEGWQEEPHSVRVSSGLPGRRIEQVLPVSELREVGGQGVRKGLASALARMNRTTMVLAVLGYLLSQLIIACRWWMLLRIQEVYISLWESVRLTFLGLFFNTIVPGTVGGDLVKAYYVSKHTERKAAVLVSVFIDRILGLTELTVLAAVMIVVVWSGRLAGFERIRLPLVTVIVVAGVVVAALLLLLSPRLRKALRLQRFYQHLWIARHLADMGWAAAMYRRHLGRLVQAILFTFGAHVAWVASIAMIGRGLSLGAWYEYFLYIPLIYIIGAVPLTPGGIGLIEQFYLFFFRGNPSEVLALALLARLVPIFWGLPGALVAISGPRLPKKETLAQELGLGDDASEKPPPD